ncbi:non-ribosomal peptide synthetase [Bacillus sp. SRB3LM]|uniref:non-ribosomal peptide synthetase n=1 Tax=Bacillus sp. SRB3LM TaxID=2608689 RepID=UPI0018C4410E|nr:non-ribosomal peptide synthetase [Bacillus sp. SRB3LM]MBG0969475.1 non-ribosomal peptide synthetase [Bacillus sp. SRB3LM]MBG0971978.1 non-ribosomal peptide synthetase [Bacillus sp. SRB3LM]MBG0972000.1 non-ribosomal peptide synthetase [Bacillus sp. SRB3LM]
MNLNHKKTSSIRKLTLEQLAHMCLHQIVEFHADHTPEQIVVIADDKQLTYKELNVSANQVANLLKEQGRGIGDFIGLYIERSVEMIIGLLGILKSGATYVPLETELPKDRIEYIVNSANCSLILSSKKSKSTYPLVDRPIITVDDPKTKTYGIENLNISIPLHQLMYVMFTSGSTGNPKGVLIEHKNVTNYIVSLMECLNINDKTNFASVSTLSADLGNTSIFGALASAGTLHILSKEQMLQPDEFSNYFSTHSVDCLKITPSHFYTLLHSAEENIFPKQYLILGGELLKWEIYQEIKKRAGACKIVNHYGPTETTIGVAMNVDIDDNLETETKSVPIGKAIRNNQIVIFDKDKNLSKQGTIGELCVIGENVGRGYLEKVTGPQKSGYLSINGKKAYQTGDIGRYLSDDSIEIIGRIDDQIQIRGYRVELAEIEKAIFHYTNVQNVYVHVNDKNNVEKEIIAFVSVKNAPIDESNLKNFLKETLPSYMIPSIIIVDAIPLDANGKVNKKILNKFLTALPEKKQAQYSKLHQVLLNYLGTLINNKHITITDNFFDIGGSSLQAIQLISWIRDTFHIPISIRSFLANPTVDTLYHFMINHESKQNVLTTAERMFEKENVKYQNEDTSEIISKYLQKKWAQVLRIQDVQKDDNFFDIGGSSLQIISLMNWVRKELNVPISIRSFLINPTITHLTKLILTEVTDVSEFIRQLTQDKI